MSESADGTSENVNIHLPSLHPLSWFDRMWTIQEVALAQKVEIVTTQRNMDYDALITNLDKWLTERLNQPAGGYAWGHIMMEGDRATQRMSFSQFRRICFIIKSYFQGTMKPITIRTG